MLVGRVGSIPYAIEFRLIVPETHWGRFSRIACIARVPYLVLRTFNWLNSELFFDYYGSSILVSWNCRLDLGKAWSAFGRRCSVLGVCGGYSHSRWIMDKKLLCKRLLRPSLSPDGLLSLESFLDEENRFSWQLIVTLRFCNPVRPEKER